MSRSTLGVDAAEPRACRSRATTAQLALAVQSVVDVDQDYGCYIQPPQADGGAHWA